MLVFFVAAPIAIGSGISIAKRKHSNTNSDSNVNVVNPGVSVDANGVPTIPTGPDANGLSYGDWFCGECRCVKDQDALAKCLEGLNKNTRR